MAAITDLSELINLQSGGNNGNPENIFFQKMNLPPMHTELVQEAVNVENLLSEYQNIDSE
jgi:hypothetical protein